MIWEITSGTERTLDVVLLDGDLIAPEKVLEVFQDLVHLVAELHAVGRVHLEISASKVFVTPDGLSLSQTKPTVESRVLKACRDWSPEELRRLPRELPTDLAAARQALESAGISIDPRSFDLMSLGDILCLLLTREPASAYRQSARVKRMVPTVLRSVLERCTGCDGQAPFHDAQELGEALAALGSQKSTERFSNPATEAILPVSQTDLDDTAMIGVSGLKRQEDTSVESEEQIPPPGREIDIPFYKLGHFEIQCRIGRGGMGDVYRGYELSLDRTVAIKVLPAEFARQNDFVRRFQAEATAAARLIHPNIIQIYFIGEDAGHHFFAMQYVDGVSLATLLESEKKLDVNTTFRLVEQVLLGLEAAHGMGFVHRDIKPANILIDQAKQKVLLADFGLVKQAQSTRTGLTATGMILGTVDYISPEQGRGQNVDARSDLYAVGVLMYRMLSGKLPFKADSPTALIFQHVYEIPCPLTNLAPEVPESLATIVHKLMEKLPSKRYQTAREVLDDLYAFQEMHLPKTGCKLQVKSAGSESSEGGSSGSSRRSAAIDNLASLSTIPELDGLPQDSLSGWNWVRRRLQAMFHKYAPQALRDLQNTQQQIGGALALYETRRDELKQLVSEAETVQDELTRATEQARGKPEAETLLRQLGEQNEQLDVLKLRLAKVQSTLQQLVTKRDLLNARLKAAEGRLKNDGSIDNPKLVRRKGVPRLVIPAVLIVSALVFLIPYNRTPAPVPAAPSTTPQTVPPPAVAPFNADQAKVHQTAWAEHLGVPVEYTNSIGMKFVLIPPGEFVIGTTPESTQEILRQGDSNHVIWRESVLSEAPPHRVILSHPIFLGAYEVTQQQFQKIMNFNPSHFSGTKAGSSVSNLNTDQFPVEGMTWYEAVEFCVKLSQQENLTPCYTAGEEHLDVTISGTGYRLPTEAEWEFACRAGTTTTFWVGESEEQLLTAAWFGPNSGGRTHDVGGLRANPFGLYDVHGNVSEWCQDIWTSSYYGQFADQSAVDPQGPSLSSFQSYIIRGGNWIDQKKIACRSSYRFPDLPSYRLMHVGFRVSLSAEAVREAMKKPPSARRSEPAEADQPGNAPRQDAVAEHQKMAETLRRARRFANALPHFRKIVALSESLDQSASGPVKNRVRLGEALWYLGDFLATDGRGLPTVRAGEAEAAFARASNIFEQLAVSDVRINRSDLNGALAEGNAPITLKSLRSLCHGMYGQLLAKSGRYDDAVVCYLTAIKFDPRDGNNVERLRNVISDHLSGKPSQAALIEKTEQEFLGTPRYVDWCAIRRRIPEAITAMAERIHNDPNDEYALTQAASLLAHVGDTEGFRQCCRELSEKFGGTQDPVVAERIARICLVLPGTVEDQQMPRQLASRAVDLTRTNPGVANSQLTQGLLEYRTGQYESACQWLEKSLSHPAPHAMRAYGQAMARLLLAMAQEQRGNNDESRRLLVQAIATSDSLPRIEIGQLLWFYDWHDGLCVEVLRREAEKLFADQ